MKINKAQGILQIYEVLLRGNIINRGNTAEKLGVSRKTVSRYINELNSYLQNQNKNEHIIYCKDKDGYILESKSRNMLSKKDILTISKVLLESRGLNKIEIQELIDKLLQNCIYIDRENIKQVIGNELHNYTEPRHSQPIIDKIWDISQAIIKQKKIEMEYLKIGKNGELEKKPINRILIPQGILFSEYYFYLLALIDGKDFEFPVIYRIDRIKKYNILKEGFRINYSERFEEGEFRKLIQFMQAGKLQTIVFKFTGASIEAVLDRLPNAEILDKNKGEYLIKAKTFGRGIKMWLLSQGDAIEVIEPQEFRNDIKNIIENMLKNYR